MKDGQYSKIEIESLRKQSSIVENDFTFLLNCHFLQCNPFETEQVFLSLPPFPRSMSPIHSKQSK